MLFWILMVVFGFSLLALFVVPLGFALTDPRDRLGSAFIGFMPTLLVAVMVSLPVTAIWQSHANDLSKVRAQQPVIEVYEERRDTLATVLENFNYPIRDGITLNADSPVASVVEQLSEVESKLADVKAEVALARRSIEARRAGPMGGIVTLMGDE